MRAGPEAIVPVASGPRRRARATDFVVFGVAFVCVLTAALSSFGDQDPDRFGVLIETARRVSALLYVAFLAARPVKALGFVGSLDLAALSKGFAIAFATYLGLLVLPYVVEARPMPVLTVLFCIVNAAGLSALLWSLPRRQDAGAGRNRTLAFIRGLMVAYFWMSFAAVAIAHLYGPYRGTDGFYGLSLLLLVAALVLRFIADFLNGDRGEAPALGGKA